MLRYKTETRPGLVALYDIRPGNGAGPLQSRSPINQPIDSAIYLQNGWDWHLPCCPVSCRFSQYNANHSHK